MGIECGMYAEEGREWYVYRIPYLTVGSSDRFVNAGMQVYLPTYTRTVSVGGRKTVVQKPKILDYLFVLATSEQVGSMAELYNVRPVCLRNTSDGYGYSHWMTVPTAQMHRFMLLVQGYEETVQFCMPEYALLEKGDTVRVTEGPFRGVEGILLSSQGRSGGQVYVELSEGMGVKTISIPDRSLQVLSVSRDSNRFCRNLQAFEKVLEKALQTKREEGSITGEQCEQLEAFLFRYSELHNLTYVSQAKMAACRYAANMLLQRTKTADACIARYESDRNESKYSRRASQRSTSAGKYIDSWVTRFA